MDETVTKKLFDVFRLTTFLKARYPQWNETAEGVKSIITGQKEQYADQSVAVLNELFNPLLRYEKTTQVYRENYQKLTPEEQEKINASKEKIKKYALVFFKDDIETHFNRILTAVEENNMLEKTDSFLNDEEKNWAQIYGQVFGKEALSDVYGLYNRKEPNIVLSERAFPEYSSPEVDYERAKLLAERCETNKIYLQSFYPTWNEKEEAVNHLNGNETEIHREYIRQQTEINQLYEKMTAFQKFSFDVERKIIAKKCNQLFQKQLEEMITDEYAEYKEQEAVNGIWDFSFFNKCADIYQQRYGTEALMKIPAVQEVTKEFHIQEKTQQNLPAEQKKNNEKENINQQGEQGLSSVLTKVSSLNHQESNPLSDRTEPAPSALFLQSNKHLS